MLTTIIASVLAVSYQSSGSLLSIAADGSVSESITLHVGLNVGTSTQFISVGPKGWEIIQSSGA